MTWNLLKRWLQHKKQNPFHQNTKMQLVENESKTQITATLEQLPTMYIKDYGYIPVILVNAAFVINKNLRVRNLFQTRGDDSKIMAGLLARHRKGRLKSSNVHDVVEALKTVLVSLSDSLLPNSVCNALIKASQDGSMSQYIFVLNEFRSLSPYHFAILHFVMSLLKKISEHAAYNGMNERKLAAIFVLDVIRPIEQEAPNEELLVAAESVERLPFLIGVVENLIQNVDVFKMVSSLDGVAASIKEQHQRKTESQIRSYQSPTERSAVDLGLCDTSTQKDLMIELVTLPLAGTASHEERAHESSHRIRETPTNIILAHGNTTASQDFDPGAQIRNNTNMSPRDFETIQSHKRNTKKFRIASTMKSSLTRRKSVKADKVQSSPGKRLSQFASRKKFICSTKKMKKTSGQDDKKENEAHEESDVSRLGSDYTTGQQNEDMWSIESSSSEDVSLAPKPSSNQRAAASAMSDPANQRAAASTMSGPANQRAAASTMSDPKRLEHVLDQESMQRQHKLKNYEMFSENHEHFTDNHDGRLNLMSGKGNEAEAAEYGSIRIMGNRPAKIAGICVSVCSHEDTTYGRSCVKFSEDAGNTGVGVSSSLEVSIASPKQVPQLPSEAGNASSPFWKLSVSTEGKKRNILTSSSELDKHVKEDSVGKLDKNMRASIGPTVARSESLRECSQIGAPRQSSGFTAVINEEDAIRAGSSQANEPLPPRGDTECQTPATAPHKMVVIVKYNPCKPPTRFRPIRQPRPVKRSAHLGGSTAMDREMSQQASLEKWFVDIFMVCLIVFWTCLLLQMIQCSTDENWLK